MHIECWIFDCMIRRQRDQVIRDLWRLRAWKLPDQGYHNGPISGPKYRHSTTEIQMKSAFNSLVKRLDLDELEILLESVKAKGLSSAQCILVPHPKQNSETLPLLSASSATELIDSAPQRFVCRMWRWPELTNMDRLKCLPKCRHCFDPTVMDSYLCINPFHWSRAIQTDTKLLDNDHFPVKVKHKLKCDISSETETNDMDSIQDYWCRIGYRELNELVGQLFPVIPQSIDIFQDIPQGTGISLAALHKNHVAKSDKVDSIRNKIGAGITLSLEDDQVWLYNRSTSSIFVSSYSLNLPSSTGSFWRVYKVNPGYSIVIYDYRLMESWSPDPFLADGPVDPQSIHISFVKGWGHDYRRQSVLHCACWLEVLINVNR